MGLGKILDRLHMENLKPMAFIFDSKFLAAQNLFPYIFNKQSHILTDFQYNGQSTEVVEILTYIRYTVARK